MRPSLLAIALTLCLLSIGRAAQPNVLFISIDDLNDWIEPLGGHPQAKTPNFNRLAAKSINFTRNYCPSPGCNPSRSAVMTGYLPHTSGMYSNYQDWRKVMPDAVTIGEHFRNNGYFSAGAGKIFHYTQVAPKCWDAYYPSLTEPMPDYHYPKPNETVNMPKFEGMYGDFDWAPIPLKDEQTGDGKSVAWIADQLSRAHEKPFFLACGIYRPHLPWYVPQEYFDLHPLESIKLPEVLKGDLDDLGARGKDIVSRGGGYFSHVTKAGQWKQAVQGYLASISFADAMLGRLLDALEQSPHANNTIIALWSDHGWQLGEKEHFRKFALWDNVARSVMMINVPEGNAALPSGTSVGADCHRVTSLIDLYPTLNELCGLPPRDDLDGRSLLPLLRDPSATWDHPAITAYDVTEFSIRTERWRYIRYIDDTEELYDHETDPNEWHNLAADPLYQSHKVLLAKMIPPNPAPLKESTLIELSPHHVPPYLSKEDYRQRNAPPEEPSKPNVLFIVVDDLRPSIGSYGDPLAVTPNIDALASQGVQFNRAYCQVAVCNPSRASLMTGMRPDKLGVWTLPIHFREAKPDAITLPQWFRKSGYTAVSHGKIYHNPTPDPQSWSERIRPRPRLPYPYPEGTRQRVIEKQAALPKSDWRKNNLRGPSTAAPDLPDDKLLDGARTNMAIEDLRRLGKQEAPFFLAMGYIRPHLSWVAPKKYWDLHDPDKLPVLTDQRITPDTPPYALHNNSELRHYEDLMNLPRPWEDRELPAGKARQLVHGYYACVSYIDAQIGRLMAALDEEGLRDNTIVILWSDHGWKLGEYRGWGKMTNYEIDARVPLIISTPGMPTAGQQTEQLAELLDLYPTLCDLVGIETPDFVDGRSLKPILQNVAEPVHTASVNQYYRRANGAEYMGYSIRTNDYRMIEWREFATGEVTARELYDHRGDDHSETNNIAESAEDGVIETLTAKLLETHPRKGLVMTPTIHSNPGRWPGRITFLNKTDTVVNIHHITSTGGRGRAKSIEPTGERLIKGKIGDVYVVESVDGKIHQIHSTSSPGHEVVLQLPSTK